MHAYCLLRAIEWLCVQFAQVWLVKIDIAASLFKQTAGIVDGTFLFTLYIVDLFCTFYRSIVDFFVHSIDL